MRQRAALLIVVLVTIDAGTDAFESATAWREGTFVRPCIHRARGRQQRHHRSQLLHLAPQQLGEFEPLTLEQQQSQLQRRVIIQDWTRVTPLDFTRVWDYQKQVVQGHVDRLGSWDAEIDSFLSDQLLQADGSAPSGTTGVDRILFLEHESVYTLGTGSDPKFILSTSFDASEQDADDADATAVMSNIPIVRMDRGGEVTFHGPGQLVVYPLLDLRSYNQDIHWYMRALEEAILLACSMLPLSHTPVRDVETTGVWMDNFKIAALGVKCRKWITQHGLAVNVEERSLTGFDGIVPCGLDGRKVACLNQFLPADQQTTVQEFAPLLQEALKEVFAISLVRSDETM